MNWRILMVVFLCTPTFVAEAAALYLDPAQSTINQGDVVVVSVRVDVDEAVSECINAIDGVLEYSPQLQLIDTSIGNSIFPIWVEQPTINEASRQVTFAGGIPNGYCGRVVGDPQLTNVVVQLVFRALVDQSLPSDGPNQEAFVQFTNASTIYLNDGFGTPINGQNYDAQVSIRPTLGESVIDPWQDAIGADQIPPEDFSITLERDETTFGGTYYIVFNTTDKQSGISYYEVMEEPLSDFGLFRFGAADAPWQRTRSPYQLDDQSLNSTIRVRAVDKAGNEYVATLIPDASLRSFSLTSGATLLGAATFVVVGALGIIAFVWWRRRREQEYEVIHATNHDQQ